MATCYQHPFGELEEIEKYLAARGVQGPVLLDLPLANASVTDRYFQKHFDGAHFSTRPAVPVASKPEMEAWSKRAFGICPVLLDFTLLLTEETRGLVFEKGALVISSSPDLHSAVFHLA